MPNEKRLIDLVAAPQNPKEMKVLVLGLARTATKSMQTALEQLGYTAYHMSSAFRNTNHFNLWNEAIMAKYHGIGKPYGRAEFEKLLQNYDAVTDAPAVLFSEELLAAYPNAKVVLTNRDPDKWVKSMDSTILTAMAWPSWKYLARFDPKMIGPFYKNQIMMLDIWTNGDTFNRAAIRAGFVEHYTHVRKLVPKSNLLEHEPKDGFEPLCEFLGKDIPVSEEVVPGEKKDGKQPLASYPNINDSAHLLKMMNFFWKILLVKAAGKTALWCSPLAVVGAGMYYFGHLGKSMPLFGKS